MYFFFHFRVFVSRCLFNGCTLTVLHRNEFANENIRAHCLQTLTGNNFQYAQRYDTHTHPLNHHQYQKRANIHMNILINEKGRTQGLSINKCVYICYAYTFISQIQSSAAQKKKICPSDVKAHFNSAIFWNRGEQTMGFRFPFVLKLRHLAGLLKYQLAAIHTFTNNNRYSGLFNRRSKQHCGKHELKCHSYNTISFSPYKLPAYAKEELSDRGQNWGDNVTLSTGISFKQTMTRN